MIDTTSRRVASWALAVLSAAALTVAVLTWYADRTVFNSDGFAARADAALRKPEVSRELARRTAAAAIANRPDLVAVRPLLETVAQSLVGGPAFRSLARGAVRDAHRSVFDTKASTVTLTLADTGVLIAEALRQQRPDLAASIPDDLPVRLGRFQHTALRAVELSERVRNTAIVSRAAGAGAGRRGAARDALAAGRARAARRGRRRCAARSRWRPASWRRC